MRTTIVLLALAACFATTGCKHYCHTNPFPVVRLSGFDSSDLYAVIVSSHSAGSGIAPEQQTRIYTSRRVHGYDTLAFDSFDTLKNAITLGFSTDATIYIPGTGRTYNISRLSVGRDTWESVKCTNSMSYSLNDTIHTQAMIPQPGAPGIIEIKK